LIGQLLDRMTAGTKPKVDREIKRDAYREQNDLVSNDVNTLERVSERANYFTAAWVIATFVT
jgi:hypothetical protein